MAQIISRNNKLYLRYYDKITGKKKDKALGLSNNRDGLRLAKEQKKLFEANLLEKYYSLNTIIKNRLSIDEAAEIFHEVKKHAAGTMEVMKLAIGHLKEATGKKYVADLDRMDFRKFSVYLSKYISKDKVNKKTEVVTQGKLLSANTKSIYSRSLRNFFGWLKSEKYVKENHVILEKGETKQIEIIPDIVFSEIKSYLWNLNKNGYYFVRLLELTGLRKSSALSLRWEQIDFEKKVLLIDNIKKNRQFIFPLTEEIILLLTEIGIQSFGKIFTYTSDGLHFWYRAQEKLNIKKPYGLHQIRKTFISNLVNDGVLLSDVATLADHRSIQTTQQYYVKSNIERLRLLLDGKKPSPQPSPQMVRNEVQSGI